MSEFAVRAALSAVIVGACAFAGRSLAKADMRRASMLAETMDSMQLLRIHMLDGLAPLNTALCRSNGYIMKSTGELMADMTVTEAWLEISAKQTVKGGRLDSLDREDIAVLDRFFYDIGRSSQEELRHIFDTTIRELGRLEAAARTGGDRKYRMYTSLGALTGLAVVVALM